MQLERYADRLRTQLAAVADAGPEETRALAERMSVALEPAIRLALLELLSDAAGEITRELAPGGVDVRLRGQDPELVVTRPADPTSTATSAPSALEPTAPEPTSPRPAAEDEPATFRTTLRLPDRLKTRVEQTAAAEGVSVNTWLVRAVGAALEAERPRPPVQNGSRFTGWVR